MRDFFTCLKIFLASALRSPRTWIPAAVIPLVFAAAVLGIPPHQQAAPIQVGVSEELWPILEARSGTVVEFIPTDLRTMEGKVATGQWDCGIAAEPDFRQRIEAGDVWGILTVVTGPGSVAYPIVEETLAAALMELTAPVIGAEYLSNTQLLTPREAEAFMRDRYRVQTEEQRVLIRMKTLDGAPLDALTLAKDQTGRLLRGILALILLTAALYLTQDLGGWLDSPWGRRMLAVRQPGWLLLPRAAAGMLGPAVGAAAAMVFLGLKDLPAALVYLQLLLAGAVVLARGRRRFPAAMTPFLVLAAALLSPMVFDVGTLWAPAGWLSGALPVTLFLRACQGSVLSWLGLGAEAAALTGLALRPGQ